MVQQSGNELANKFVLALSISTLLIGLTTACSQRSLTTQSGQTTRQDLPQATNQAATETEVFTVVEIPPSFPGGNAQISSYFRQNLRYPQAALNAKAEGKVFVSFIVTKEGAIQDVTILKGLGHGINEEAKRLVETMPNWIPGRQSGRAVNVKYNLVVPFELARVN